MTVLTDGRRPKSHSPEFRPYFEAVINSSKNLTEAKLRMGYDDPSSVRYHMRKFGIKAPNHWSPGPSPRPSARGPDFRAYFEEVIATSKGSQEAAERMGYASRYTVVHHMKRLGIKKPDGWQSRPSGYSPDFKQYFERVVNGCRSVTEAAQKLGYSRPASVRHNMKRFGIKTPDCWYSQPDARRRPKDPGFRAYFEGVVKSSENAKEVMEKLQYTSPNSVWYQMKKQGIRTPDSWHGHPSARGPEFVPYFKNIVETSKMMSRPPFGSPEWLAYFEMIVRTSKTRGEAVSRLGYANPSVIYYHLKKFGVERPPQWNLKPGVSRQRRGRVPDVIIFAAEGRAWVGALTQGEGCIKTHYSKTHDTTSLELGMAMTDSAPIFKFCDLVGTQRPKKPRPRPIGRKPVWSSVVGGLRAYRVLQEILPFLLGQKLDEAKKALDFFPDGYHDGCFGGYEVWPENEFPLRKRGPSEYKASLRARGLASSKQIALLAPSIMDVCCMKIANMLIQDKQLSGSTQAEIAKNAGLDKTTVIHHMKHLERNSLVMKEKLFQRRGGPRLLYKPDSKLLEIKAAGRILQSFEDPVGEPAKSDDIRA